MSEKPTKSSETKRATKSPRRNGPDPSHDRALACARAAIDKKAENLKILDLSEHSGFTDYFVICSGMSDRQVQSIAENIQKELREQGVRPLAAEGLNEGRWAVMDFGDVVVHVFLDAIRDYYDLESLWSKAPRVPVPPDFFGPAATAVS